LGFIAQSVDAPCTFKSFGFFTASRCIACSPDGARHQLIEPQLEPVAECLQLGGAERALELRMDHLFLLLGMMLDQLTQDRRLRLKLVRAKIGVEQALQLVFRAGVLLERLEGTSGCRLRRTEYTSSCSARECADRTSAS
jgi:hypothetical protein